MCKARGSNPGPTEKIVYTIMHVIADTIVHVIVKFNMRTKYAQMHECVTHGPCLLDDGQWPGQPKNGQWTDHFKNDASSKKICSLQDISF